MKTVAVAMAASLGLAIAGCALDRNVEGAVTVAAESQNPHPPGASQWVFANQEVAEKALSGAHDAVVEGGGVSGVSATESEPISAPPVSPTVPTAPVTTAPTAGANEQGVRDAKEATEEAARKIYGAAVGAATKIREVGREAVQSVFDSGGREKAEAALRVPAQEADSGTDLEAQRADLGDNEARDGDTAQQ